jgi:hypothetical protein
MKRGWKRWGYWLALPMLGAGLGLVMYCSTHRVWTIDQWRVYRAMEVECHPEWRDFHYGSVRAGELVEEVIGRTEPVSVERDGRWAVLKYHRSGLCFTGITAAAYDGRMVGAYAWSCTWTRRFFDTMSDQQCNEFFGEHYDQPARTGGAVFVP